MDQGFKHFSHMHNLIMHQIPKGIEVSCSGCHSSAIGTTYVCWQCNFFLHDQCYRATRSLNHPSHPPHPLTLAPYPTYHSNSFYCSSCQIIGTGFSYSCAECEFDLHVQCAYSISQATSFKNAHLFQELVPQGRNDVQNSSIDHHVPYASVPETLPNSVSGHDLACGSFSPYNLASVFIPSSCQNPLANAQNPSLNQTGPSASIPTSHSPNAILSSQDPSMPQYPPSVSIPTGYHNSSAQYPYVEQSGPSIPIPTDYRQNPVPYAQDPSKLQDGLQDKEVMHFSHPHKLSRVNLQKDEVEEEEHEEEHEEEGEKEEENEVICSGCEERLVGNGYSCVEPDCYFHLHESCFQLKKEIHHKSHPEHPLTLLLFAPYDNKDGEFTCNACFSDGTGFTYHCSICAFDLHITCVSLPETAKRDDHKHTLKLFYSCPVKDEDIYCNVCHGEIEKDHWVYYCEQCDYGTHLGCVDCEEYKRNSIVDPQAQLQILQFQMEMARRNAQFMASCGSSLASLAG